MKFVLTAIDLLTLKELISMKTFVKNKKKNKNKKTTKLKTTIYQKKFNNNYKQSMGIIKNKVPIMMIKMEMIN